MVKVFISQPMRGLSDEEILKEREKTIESVKATLEKEYDEVVVIDSFFKDIPEVKTIPLYYLAKSIELLSEADIAVFCKGWDSARGCKIEHECAKEYGLTVIEM